MTSTGLNAALPARPALRVGDVFGRSVEMFTRRPGLFLLLALIDLVPSYVLNVLLGRSEGSPLIVGATVAAALASLICWSLITGAITYGVVQEMRGRPFGLQEALAISLRRLLPLIGVALCFVLVVGLGLMALVVPGIIVMCMYYVAWPACLVERRGVFDALSRSAALTRGYRWPIFGIALLLVILSSVAEIVFGVVPHGLDPMAVAALTTLWSAVVGAFQAVVAAVLYVRLRIAQEGFDLDQVAQVFD